MEAENGVWRGPLRSIEIGTSALEPSIRIGIYSKSWFRRLSEAFGGGRGGYLGDKTDLASQTWPAGAPGGACAKPPGSIFEDFGGLLGRFSELS